MEPRGGGPIGIQNEVHLGSLSGSRWSRQGRLSRAPETFKIVINIIEMSDSGTLDFRANFEVPGSPGNRPGLQNRPVRPGLQNT